MCTALGEVKTKSCRKIKSEMSQIKVEHEKFKKLR